jgi:hypothetical protein
VERGFLPQRSAGVTNRRLPARHDPVPEDGTGSRSPKPSSRARSPLTAAPGSHRGPLATFSLAECDVLTKHVLNR